MRSFVVRRWVSRALLVCLAIVGALAGNRIALKTETAPTVAPIPPAPTKSTMTVAPVTSEDFARPSVAASDPGVPVSEDDGAAALIDRLAPRARRGDADAAYRVYQVEALCGSAEGLARLIARNTTKDYPAVTTFLREQLAEKKRFCVGVTPAEIGERFGFLDQAIRAGNREAMRSYRVDEPTGVDVHRSDGLDPRVVAWRTRANAYLELLAGEGDRTAWSLLSMDYRFGVIVAKDLRASLRYQVAYEATIDVAEKPPFYAEQIRQTVSQMQPEEAEAAISEGRALAERFPATRR